MRFCFPVQRVSERPLKKERKEGNLGSPRPAATRKDEVQSFLPVGPKLDSKSGRNYAEA